MFRPLSAPKISDDQRRFLGRVPIEGAAAFARPRSPACSLTTKYDASARQLYDRLALCNGLNRYEHVFADAQAMTD
jgi:hypothetical protein